MDITFADKKFMVLGRLPTLTRREAWLRVQVLGGHVEDKLKKGADYFILGERVSAKRMTAAQAFGVPFLTEREFLDAVDAALAASPTEPPVEADLDAAIATLRGIFDGPPRRDAWWTITELLDACHPAQLQDLCHYVAPHVAAWGAADRPAHAPLYEIPTSYYRLRYAPSSDPADDPRVATIPWVQQLSVGVVSPKFELLTSLSLNEFKPDGDILTNLTRNPSLTRLRTLEVGFKNDATPAFYEALRTSEHLPSLDTLSLHTMTLDHADALCGEHTLDALRWVRLRHPEAYPERDEVRAIYSRLFEAGWWSGVEGLDMGLSCYFGGVFTHEGATHAYDALVERAENLPALEHLVLSDDLGLEHLFGSALLGRLERLSIATATEHALPLLRHLDENPDHGVRVLDLSRTNYRGVDTMENHRLLFGCLCEAENLERFDAIVLPTINGRDEEPAELGRLESRAQDADVTLTPSPLEY